MNRKKLIVICGTMGVGKSTVSSALNKRLENSVWLDGDWCWMMNPWIFTDENKAMVLDNISLILKNFLSNSGFKYVIFSWVLHQDSILADLLDKLNDHEFDLYKIPLIVSEEELYARMIKDNRKNIDESINRLKLYENMSGYRIDTTGKTVEEILHDICVFIS